MENQETSPETQAQVVSTSLLRAKIRNYSRQQREKLRANELDALRFGLGEIQAQITELCNLTVKDVSGLAARIKRRKHASVEDMYRLSHAFLQSLDNISAFAKIPGAIQVLVKELTGHDSERQLAASECLCNLSLGEKAVCEKIGAMAGLYLVTYLAAGEQRLVRTALWTLANVLATGGKASPLLMQMQILPKLWQLYVADSVVDDGADYREDAAICLQQISMHADQLINVDDHLFITSQMQKKNPTCAGGEYHLQILFNCNVVAPSVVLDDTQLLYLINYSTSNIMSQLGQQKETDFNGDNAMRLRIIYALRVLGNLMATQSSVCSVLLTQLTNVWQSNLLHLFNSMFALRNPWVHKETFWFLQTLLQQETSTVATLQGGESWLQKLRVPQVNQIIA